MRGKCPSIQVYKHAHKGSICKWPARVSAAFIELLIILGSGFYGVKVYLHFIPFTGTQSANLHYC